MYWYKKILYTFCSTCRPNRSRTVRYAFPVVLSTLVILGAVAVTSSDKTYIEVIPSQTSVRAGNSIELDVYVSAHRPVNAIDIVLEIPTSQLRVTGIDTGESVITLWTVDPYVDGNTVVLRGGTFRKGFLGKHLIATVNAKAVNSGIAYIDVTESLLLAGDGKATEISATELGSDNVTLYIANADGDLPIAEGTEASTFRATTEIYIVTDIDGDGAVTLADISRFMAAWRSGSAIFDFSGDGRMTFRDFAIILADSFFR